jgi:hypothetical protein
MADDTPLDNPKIDAAFIDKVVERRKGRLNFYFRRTDRDKLSDKHIIKTIDLAFKDKADEIQHINLHGCVGITDATLSHIATNCTQLEDLKFHGGCVKITGDGIKDLVEKIGKKLKILYYSDCNRCSDAALQAVVEHCPNLEELRADNTGMTQIPENIGDKLRNLSTLSLKDNRIKILPLSIADLDIKLDLSMDGNLLEFPPEQTVKKGMAAIHKYFANPKNSPKPLYKEHLKKEQTFTHKNWEMVGTDIEKFVKDALGAAAGDVTSSIGLVDKLSSFGASETNESKNELFVEKVPPKHSGDHDSLVAVKIETKETSEEAGILNILQKKSSFKSAIVQIFCMQPENNAACQELKGLGHNFSNIESFYDKNFVLPTIKSEDKKPQV